MFTKIRQNIVAAISALALVLVPMVVPVMVSADTVQSGLCNGINSGFTGGDIGSDSGGCGATTTNSNGLAGIAKTILNIFSWVVGIVSVIMIIMGGFRYITSGGDSGKVTSAKNTIVYAIIGLIIVALAQVIVAFVVNKAINAGS